MASDRRYYDDSYTTAFDARVAGTGEHKGRAAVELETTFFYPESGGQEADRGVIAGAKVVDVQSDDDGRVWHVVDGDPGAGGAAEIDWARRFDNMQQHTGQHVLSAAFERVMDVATVSSHLGEQRSSLEMALPDADWKTIAKIEEAANRVLWENRPIRLHWTDDANVSKFPLRRPPKVSGKIRLVEIADWDWSACGGTHTRHTGEVGAIKIVRWDKVRGNVRIEFLCGQRAFDDYAWRTELLVEGAKRRTLKDRELIAHLEKAAEERDELRKKYDELSDRLALAEAQSRLAASPGTGIADLSPVRTRDEVRRFALKCLEAGAPWAIAASTSSEPTLVIARPKGSGVDLRTLADELKTLAAGKGGGGPDCLQLLAADGAHAEAAFRRAVEMLEAATRA